MFVIIFALVYMCYQQILVQEFNDMNKVLLFLRIILLNFMCTQCLSTILAIIFEKKLAMAILMNMTMIGILGTYCNFYFLIDSTPKLIQIISNFLYQKYLYNSLLILIYGFGRCSDGQQSRVLIEFKLEDDQDLFWKYTNWSYICYGVLFLVHFVAFWVKSCKFSFNFVDMIKDSTNNQDLFENESSEFDRINNNNFEMNCITIDHGNEVKQRQIMISWFNICLVTQNDYSFKNNSKVLLDNVSGYFEANSSNAVMGPSGAGKTTLLEALNGKLSGSLSDSSKLFVQRINNYNTSFIKQNVHEHFHVGLTVRQTLLYASKLKNSRITKHLDHNQIVSELMSEFLISDTADNRVEFCSGGEQKKVIIATELTAYKQPSILFIDEPTSGLDSNAAEVIIECLKRLSRSHHMTVISSIHQPNQQLFYKFDSVYVLAKGGVCVYSGFPKNLRQHLNECRIDCNENLIPIEVLLKVCSEEKTSENITQLIVGTNETLKQLNEICLKQNMQSVDENVMQNKIFSLKDLNILFRRTLRHTFVANWRFFALQLFVFILLSVVMSVHYNLDMIEPKGCITIEGGCKQTPKDVQNEILIKQNIKYHWGLLGYTFIIMIIFPVIPFSIEYKTVCNEINNSKSYLILI